MCVYSTGRNNLILYLHMQNRYYYYYYYYIGLSISYDFFVLSKTSDSDFKIILLYKSKTCRRWRWRLVEKHEFSNKKINLIVYSGKGSPPRWQIKMLIYKLSAGVLRLLSSSFFFCLFLFSRAVCLPFGHAHENILPD